MTDEQTAAEIMRRFAPTIKDFMESDLEAAIVRALRSARESAIDTHANAAVLRMCHEARMMNGIVDYSDPNATGVVRRVLGVLPVTIDGMVIGDECTVFREDVNYEKMNRPRFYGFDVGRNRTRVETWSTREAAEAAKEAP